MTQKIFTVMGATGQIGHVVVDDLLRRGHIVRAIGRDEKKMKNLLHKGAEIYFAEFDDVSTLTDAFKGSYAVFCLLPPGYGEQDLGAYQDRVGEAICEALKNAKVDHVVNLSSLGANLKDNTGPIKGLYRQEKRLEEVKNLKTLIHLRPGYFMENLTWQISSIINEGEISSILSGDLPLGMIATRDIGWKAADFMDRSDPVGHVVFEFVGPQEITLNEAALMLGQAIEKPELRYVQITEDEERERMLSQGMNEKIVDLVLEMYRAFNQGLIKSTQEMTLEHHGITTFEEFASMMAHKMLALGRR